MKIEIQSEEAVFITVNNWVYYIDDSTGEQLVTKWKRYNGQKSTK